MAVHRQVPNARAHVVRQTVSRTADRVHVSLGGGREWLFERNPIDPRRVSGSLVEHARRTIVLHEESDLRNMLGVNGWADVLLIGLDSAALRRLPPTGRTRTLGGLTFEKHAADQIERVRTGVDAGVLRSPSEGFPAYAVMHLAEWLEGH